MSEKAYISGSEYPELKSGTLRLYSSRFCPYAQRARLVLQHKNIAHEIINIDLKDKPQWFLERAPLGKVPVLHSGDKILFESTAVSEYLDDVYPGDKLQAECPYMKAWNRILLEYFGQLSSAWYGLRSATGEEEVTAKINLIQKHYQFLEDELAKRGTPYFGGSKPGMTDFFIWPWMERLPAVVRIFPQVALCKADFPKMAAWMGIMTQVPAVKKEMFDTDCHHQVLQLLKEGKRTADHGLE